MAEDKFNSNEATLSVDLSEATQAVKENRFEEAIELFEIILTNHPDNIDSLYLASVSSRYLKQFDDSKKYIERLLLNAPDMGRAYQELGHIFRDMGDESKAVVHYRQACELNPALLASWNSLYKYFVKNKNQPAAEHAREQIEKLQSLPPTLLYIDQIMNEGRLGLAETKCRAFLKQNPTHTYAMSLLSEIANRLGYFDDAEFLLEKAVEFKPNDGDLRMKYATILRKKQKFAKTMEQVNILCDQFPDNHTYQAQKASEIMQNGGHEEAIKLLNSLNIYPTLADARFAKPIDKNLIDKLLDNHKYLITIEEGSSGGFDSSVLNYIHNERRKATLTKVNNIYFPDRYIDHQSSDDQYREIGMDADSIANKVIKFYHDNVIDFDTYNKNIKN